ncbi:hypothetical protein Tco_1374872 [Tanacetum coccineum]
MLLCFLGFLVFCLKMFILDMFSLDNASVVWNELKDTYDRVDGSVFLNLLQKINSFKQDCSCKAMAELDHNKFLKLMQFLLGIDDVYQPIRSSLLTREILLEVKDAFVAIAKEESHRGITPTFVKTDKPQASAFVSMSNDNRRGNNVDRCFEIIGYPPGFKRNPKLKPINFNNENNNFDASGNFLADGDIKTSTALSFTNVHVMTLISLLN